MEVIRRSPVEVGGWHPIYFAKFYTILVVSRISSINSMNLSSLSWCGSQLMCGCLMVDGFFKWICDSSMLEKTKEISSQMVLWWWFTMARSKTSPTINKSKGNMRCSVQLCNIPHNKTNGWNLSKGFLLGKRKGAKHQRKTSKFHSSPRTMMSFKTILSS